jgi:hypothetical protein
MTSPSSSGALEAVERVLNRGGEPGVVLQQVVDALHARTAAWVGIAFVEDNGVELGPSAGAAAPPPTRNGIRSSDRDTRSRSSGRAPTPIPHSLRASP